MDYSIKTRAELISICKINKLSPYSGKTKSQLIELICRNKSPTPARAPELQTSSLDNKPSTIISTTSSIDSHSELVALSFDGKPSPDNQDGVSGREPDMFAKNPRTPTLLRRGNVLTIPGQDLSSIQKNMFYVGDNMELLAKVSSGTIDMIYFDPPYNTGRNFHYFEDKFADFPEFMEQRIVECHRVLKNNGNIIIHVEPKISHQIRVICDKIFGFNNFQNEVVWHSGGNAKNKYQLGRNHDTIIIYSKSSKSKFFPLYKPYTEEYKKGLKMCTHHNKLYSTSAAHNSQPEVNPRPNLRYEWNGNVRQWYLSKEKMKSYHDDHRLEYNESGIPRIKRFLDEMEGIPVRDTWDDISSIQNGEKTRYATQKPVKLLERILALYSAEGDLCMDPFAGSGTLGRACRNMKREYILFDINPEAKLIFDKGCE
jgi:DNA modification methylase